MREEKFTEVFQRYNRMLCKIVFSRTGDRLLAEEICQQVFLIYFERMDEIEDALIQPWLLVTTQNKICDYFRKQQVRRAYLCACREDGSVTGQDDTERIIDRMEDHMLKQRILKELYEERRPWYDVIEAVCIFEMSYAEAAAHLGITEEILRARLYRARRHIRGKYGEEYRS